MLGSAAVESEARASGLAPAVREITKSKCQAPRPPDERQRALNGPRTSELLFSLNSCPVGRAVCALTIARIACRTRAAAMRAM